MGIIQSSNERRFFGLGAGTDEELMVLLKAYELIENEMNESLKNKYAVGAIFSSALLAVFLLLFNQGNNTNAFNQGNNSLPTSGSSTDLNILLYFIPYLILILAVCMVSHKRIIIYESSYGKLLEEKINMFCKLNYRSNDSLVTLETTFFSEYITATPLEVTLMIFCGFLYLVTYFKAFLITINKHGLALSDIIKHLFLLEFVFSLTIILFIICLPVLSYLFICKKFSSDSESVSQEGNKINQKVFQIGFVFVFFLLYIILVNYGLNYYFSEFVEDELNVLTYFVATMASATLLIAYLVHEYNKMLKHIENIHKTRHNSIIQ